jgi:hypothetical protein
MRVINQAKPPCMSSTCPTQTFDHFFIYSTEYQLQLVSHIQSLPSIAIFTILRHNSLAQMWSDSRFQSHPHVGSRMLAP